MISSPIPPPISSTPSMESSPPMTPLATFQSTSNSSIAKTMELSVFLSSTNPPGPVFYAMMVLAWAMISDHVCRALTTVLLVLWLKIIHASLPKPHPNLPIRLPMTLPAHITSIKPPINVFKVAAQPPHCLNSWMECCTAHKQIQILLKNMPESTQPSTLTQMARKTSFS